MRGVYAVAGDRVLGDLRRRGRGVVPVRRIVQNIGPARGYDRYLHGKVLTIQGRQGGVRSATVTLNGSANWTPLSLISDEVVLRLFDRGTLRSYTRWIERLFASPPRNRGAGPRILDLRVVDGARIQVH
ncbi:MAG: phospholipase D family protein [Nocardioides sp.]|nr:phospholipase D family protein [Nocardioides sp.]